MSEAKGPGRPSKGGINQKSYRMSETTASRLEEAAGKIRMKETPLVELAIERFIDNDLGPALAKAEQAWANLQRVLCLCGDIGDFDPKAFLICKDKPGSWRDVLPLSLAHLVELPSDQIDKPDTHNFLAWDVYDPLAIVAAGRLKLRGRNQVIFGDFLASLICGGGGGHGAEEEEEALEDAFCRVTGGLIYTAGFNPEFWEIEAVKAGVQAAFQSLK